MAPRMQPRRQEDMMLGMMMVIAGALLLLSAGIRRPARQPVRNDERERR